MESDFWKAKALRSAELKDTNRDGFVTRSDLMLFSQRYKELGASEKLLSELVSLYSEQLGLTDNSKKLTHQECMEISINRL